MEILTKDFSEKSNAPHMPGVPPPLGLNIDRCIIIKLEALDIICKNVERRARRCEVTKSSVYDLKERAPILHRVLAVPLQKREGKCNKTGMK